MNQPFTHQWSYPGQGAATARWFGILWNLAETAFPARRAEALRDAHGAMGATDRTVAPDNIRGTVMPRRIHPEGVAEVRNTPVSSTIPQKTTPPGIHDQLRPYHFYLCDLCDLCVSAF